MAGMGPAIPMPRMNLLIVERDPRAPIELVAQPGGIFFPDPFDLFAPSWLKFFVKPESLQTIGHYHRANQCI